MDTNDEQSAEYADPRIALVTAAIHLRRHPQHPHYCRCHEFAEAAISALGPDERTTR